MSVTIGQLTPEDLSRYHILTARLKTMEAAPAKYGREEIEQTYVTLWRFHGEVAERYGIDASYIWAISNYSGLLRVGEQWEPHE